MTKGKNRVIWCVEWNEIIKDLTSIQKAKFLQWFTAYVADENPNEPKDDPDLYAVIFHVKRTLKTA
jgi:hypothetical protein